MSGLKILESSFDKIDEQLIIDELLNIDSVLATRMFLIDKQELAILKLRTTILFGLLRKKLPDLTRASVDIKESGASGELLEGDYRTIELEATKILKRVGASYATAKS
jgi:hypothetical protein